MDLATCYGGRGGCGRTRQQSRADHDQDPRASALVVLPADSCRPERYAPPDSGHGGPLMKLVGRRPGWLLNRRCAQVLKAQAKYLR